MFEVVEYRHASGKGKKASKITGWKVVKEFPTLRAARKFSEGLASVYIQYPKTYFEE
jgi:hypothetical protein